MPRKRFPIVLLLGVLSSLLIVAGACSPNVTNDQPLVVTQVGSIRQHFQVEANPVDPAESADSLYPLWPNPYSRGSGDSVVAIDFSLKASGAAALLIQNPIGDEILRLQDDSLEAGHYHTGWNPLAADGTPLRPGLYFVTLHVYDVNTRNFVSSKLLYIQNND